MHFITIHVEPNCILQYVPGKWSLIFDFMVLVLSAIRGKKKKKRISKDQLCRKNPDLFQLKLLSWCLDLPKPLSSTGSFYFWEKDHFQNYQIGLN